MRYVSDKSLFFFHFQYRYKKTKRSSDFGIIDIEDSPDDIENAFFVMEAKRLPTPTPPKSREKEYVEGNLGGIERFKKGQHGTGLAKSAMVAYIQKETCAHWLTKINGWIQDLIDTSTSPDILWQPNDLLTFQNQFDTTSKYQSKNARVYNGKTDDIQLSHYRLPLND